jgi:hypothetical protein
MTDAKKQIFISYSSADRKHVVEVANALRARGVDTWLDQDVISAGDDIVTAINDGLRNASGFVVFASRAYLASKWTNAELTALVHLAVSDERKTIVVLLEPVELPALLAARRRIEWTSADAVADEIAKSAGRTAAAPEASGAAAETALKWDDLGNQDVDVLAGCFLEEYGMLMSTGSGAVQFRVPLSDLLALTLHISRPVAKNAAVIENLRASHDIVGVLQRKRNEYKKEIARGGLGIFQPSFKIALEDTQQEADLAFAALREQMQAIAPKLTRD